MGELIESCLECGTETQRLTPYDTPWCVTCKFYKPEVGLRYV